MSDSYNTAKLVNEILTVARKIPNLGESKELYSVIVRIVDILSSDVSVIKSNGSRERMNFGKIVKKLQELSTKSRKLEYVNIYELAIQVIKEISKDTSTLEINRHLAEISMGLSVNRHYNYNDLAGRLIIDNIVSTITLLGIGKFSDVCHKFPGLFADNYRKFVEKHAKVLDKIIIPDRDYVFSYESIMTLKKSYLLVNSSGKIIESPQYLWLRVAVGLWCDCGAPIKGIISKITHVYETMSRRRAIHATPTLFNAGLRKFAGISCYLQVLPEDSVPGIGEMFKRTMILQKSCGGIGTSLHELRAKGSLISTTNRPCGGIVNAIGILEKLSKYINQGGKRAGTHAVYLPMTHLELLRFLDVGRPHGNPETRITDMFYALWIPDYFWECLAKDDYWYLMCPAKYPGLNGKFAGDFVEMYLNYVKNAGKIADYSPAFNYDRDGIVMRIKARDLWKQVLASIIESSKPFLLAKDQINLKSNQKNIGPIHSSNLCCEITLHTNPNETATCCLASIKISEFADTAGNIDFKQLRETVHLLVDNLNRLLDINAYPSPETELSSRLRRAIGIGIQDLSGLRMKCGMTFGESIGISRIIQEHIYYYALERSCELSAKCGKSYEGFAGSPASRGELQFDLWKKYNGIEPILSKSLDWAGLKKKIMKNGLRNSMLLANMPTASTATILGSAVESVEPLLRNIYSRKLLSGEFPIVNRHLVDALIGVGLWKKSIIRRIIADNGQIGKITEIPERIRAVFRTVYEFGMKIVIDDYAERGPFVCQSQSMNVFPAKIDAAVLSKIYLYAHERGLKTLAYYTRGIPASDAQKNFAGDTDGDDEECLFCSA